MEAGSFKIGGIAQESESVEQIEKEPLADKETEIIQDGLPTEQAIVTGEQAPIEQPEKITEQAPIEQPKEVVEQAPIEQPIEVKDQIELDEELQRIYNFKKETNGTLADYLESQKNWDEVSDLDIIKNQVRNEHKKAKLTDEQLTMLAGKKLGIDLTDGIEDLYDADKLTLQLEASKQREALKEFQEKLNTPVEKKTEPTSNTGQAVADTVTLANGEVVDKKEYETARAKYETTVSAEVEKFKASSFSFEIGTGETKETLSLDYIVEQEDKHRMLSYLKNVPTEVIMQHVGKNGELDIPRLTTYAFQQDPVIAKKLVSKLTSQAFSKGQESVLKQETNVNFDIKRPEKKDNPYKAIYESREDIVTTKFKGF